MKKRIVPLILAIASVGLAVLSCVILPENVVIQFSASSSGVSTASKWIAIGLPLALGIGGAASTFFVGDDKAKSKGLLVSGVGVALFLVMIVVNMWMQ